MAQKRMFDKTIVDSDEFLDMPLSTQALYFHLNMRADDDGFINNPKKIMRMIGCRDDDISILNAKRFIIPFESGIVVIKHWKINNYLRGDRHKPTLYQDEKALLSEKDNGSYTLGLPVDNQLTTNGKPSIEKNRIEENRIEENREDKNSKEDVIEVIQNYFDDFDVNKSFLEYLSTRSKKSNTDLAIKRLVNKLKNCSKEEQLNALDDAIIGNYKSVFPKKSYNNQKINNNNVIDDNYMNKLLED